MASSDDEARLASAAIESGDAPARLGASETIAAGDCRRTQLWPPAAGWAAVAERPLVLGILNVTPDSFSDGGRHADPVAHGLALIAEGADIVDVGGESTRPGAERVSVEVELDRVVGVVAALAQAGATVSVDTTRAQVARAAVAAGAVLVNDVSGGLADPDMLASVAELGVGYLIMHSRGPAQAESSYRDVVAEVCAELSARVEAALAAGIAAEQIIVDPGLGFAKTAADNWALLRGLDRIAKLGYPVLAGASRKRFLGELLADESGPRPPSGRDDATAAITALLARDVRGLWGVRTHAVRAQRDAIAVARQLAREDVDGELPMATTLVTLTGVEAMGRHGVFAFEKQTAQPFKVDVECVVERPPAADDLAWTIDYGGLAERVVAVVEGESFDLIEALAARIASDCLDNPLVLRASVTVHKPKAPLAVNFDDVAARVTRFRRLP